MPVFGSFYAVWWTRSGEINSAGPFSRSEGATVFLDRKKRELGSNWGRGEIRVKGTPQVVDHTPDPIGGYGFDYWVSWWTKPQGRKFSKGPFNSSEEAIRFLNQKKWEEGKDWGGGRVSMTSRGRRE